MNRKIVSLLMMLSFAVLCTTGLLSFVSEYTRMIATVHTIFGLLFTITAFIHIFNNLRPLKNYIRSWIILPCLFFVMVALSLSYFDASFIQDFMNFGARTKAYAGVKSESNIYSDIKMNIEKEGELHVQLKRAEHFWHPQIAIWTEDTTGNYLETLFVTMASAKGLFAGGRTKQNFKSLDQEEQKMDAAYRRVNALPVWSFKRGVRSEDGMYAPSQANPLPDAITSATPLDNFLLTTSVNYSHSFVVKLEINVAFDDNEYYSEYDFPDDETFHNGTGQLGQPSIIFSAVIHQNDKNQYQMMKLEGRGHHSAKNGDIYKDLSKLSTALSIVDYIVIGFRNKKIIHGKM